MEWDKFTLTKKNWIKSSEHNVLSVTFWAAGRDIPSDFLEWGSAVNYDHFCDLLLSPWNKKKGPFSTIFCVACLGQTFVIMRHFSCSSAPEIEATQTFSDVRKYRILPMSSFSRTTPSIAQRMGGLIVFLKSLFLQNEPLLIYVKKTWTQRKAPSKQTDLQVNAKDTFTYRHQIAGQNQN